MDWRVHLILVNCDVKGLEVVVAAELSGDEVLKQEVRDGKDFHEDNRRLFGLPERRDAKFFKFRLLYGTSAYGFTVDPLFIPISESEKFWQNVINEYYAKYKGIAKWHNQLIDTAQRTGQLEIPSGRIFPIVPDQTNRGLKWPITVIKNYPVQGFGADLVMLARLEARKRMREVGLNSLLISTIHDSIVADCPDYEAELVGRILNDSVQAVPAACRAVFGYDFSLPMTAEVQVGMNKRDMKDLTFTA